MKNKTAKQTTAPQTIWLVRHGTRLDMTDPDWAAKAKRPCDPPLAPRGRLEAQAVGRRLASEKIAHLFTSPFLRTLETAQQIAEAIGMRFRIEHGLSEMLARKWFGSCPEMLPPETLLHRFPRLDPSWHSVVRPRYPETEERLFARTARTIRLLTKQFSGNLVLIGHGASVHGVCLALVPKGYTLHQPPCCLIKVVRKSGAWRMERDGSDASHLGLLPTECG